MPVNKKGKYKKGLNHIDMTVDSTIIKPSRTKKKTDLNDKTKVVYWMKTALSGDLHSVFDEALINSDMKPCAKVGHLWECIYKEMMRISVSDYISNNGDSLRHNILVTSGADAHDDDELLISLTNKYHLNINIVSLNKDLKPILYGNSKSNNIHLMHIGFKNFMPLLNIDSEIDYNLSDADKKVLENSEKDHEKALIESLYKMIQGFARAQDPNDISKTFQSKKIPYYDVYDYDWLEKNMSKVKECSIHMKNAHLASATIISKNDGKNKEISILSRKNCGYNVFEGDIVYVTINDETNCTGRVMGIKKSIHTPINSIYLCKVFRDQGSLMMPLDGSFPKIHVDNKLGRQKYRKRLKSEHRHKVSKEQKSFDMLKREEANYADNLYVSIFDMRFDENVKEADFFNSRTVKFDPETCDKFFLVFYEYWDITSMYPYGKVVGMISTYESFVDSLHLILPLCNIEPLVINSAYVNEMKRITEQVNSEQQVPVDAIPADAVVFTIDSEETQDMDDALSYHVDGNEIVIGVHISDITRYLKCDGEIYQQAERRFATAYTPKGLGVEPYYIIDKNLSTKLFSLVPNEIRAVLSVIFEFENTKPFNCRNVEFKETFIRSQYKLNYKQVEKWIDSSVIPDEVEEELFNAVITCYQIAKEHRKTRLPESYFVRQSNNRKPGYTLDNDFNARMLIEEFMLMANENVARKVYEAYPSKGLIRSQAPVINYGDWKNRLFQFSNEKFPSSLNRFCRLVNVDEGWNNDRELIVSLQYYDELKNYIVLNTNYARNMLQCDEFISEFYVHIQDWYGISQSAKYDCSFEDSNENRHFSLDKDIYTHFTSPIRRFTDVIVHHLLKSLLNPSQNTNIPEERKILEVCTIANRQLKSNKQFEKYCAPYAIFERTPLLHNFVLDCTCSIFTNDELHFVHPSLNRTACKTTVKFAHLFLNQLPVQGKTNDTSISCCLKWKKIIYSTKLITNDVFRNVFTIDHNFFAARLPASASKLFTDIRLSDGSPKPLKNKISRLCEKFIVNRSRINISSDFLADPIIEIQLELSVKDIIRIQFCSYKINGFRRVTPELMIIHPCLQLCLIHLEDPVMCFVPGGKLEMKNCGVISKFIDYPNYKDYFYSLIQLESLKETMSEKSEHTFLDVQIKWKKEIWRLNNKEEWFGMIKYDQKMCAERNVEFNEENDEKKNNETEIFEEALNSVTGDFVCIRGKMKKGSNYWVGHGAIVNVGKYHDDDNDFEVKLVVFLLTQSDFDVFDKDYEEMRFIVETYERSVPQKRQLRAVLAVKNCQLLNEIVFGKEIKSQKPNNKFLDNLYEELTKLNVPTPNGQQKMAIKKANCQKFSLIWGPPGTGKTSIGCILAYGFYLRNNGKGVIMYCGPSNESVNIIIDAMEGKFSAKCPVILRIFSKKQELADFPLPGHFTKCKPLPYDLHSKNTLREKSLHFLIRQLISDNGIRLRELDTLFNRILDKSNVVRTDIIDGISVHEYILEYKLVVKKAKLEYIINNHCDMILCTNTTAGSMLIKEFLIKQIIIDEAGMCKEPETLVPIYRAKETVVNIVLIGDHKQLRPIILDDLAAKRGLKISLFERYQFLRKEYVTMLNEQYRMHPSICEFPSLFFYDNKLKTKTSPKWSGLKASDFEDGTDYDAWNGVDYTHAKENYQEWLRLSSYSAIADDVWPGQRRENYSSFEEPFDVCPERIVFINVIGEETVQSISTTTCSENSKANEAEVKEVGYIYEKLILKIWLGNETPKHITVLTQYRLQESLLLIECTRILTKYHIETAPIVQTVIKSQGSENDYVIFSTVRSLRNRFDITDNPSPGWECKYLGFITDHNQVNVALTRARMGLIIIGNKELLSVNKMWKNLLINLKQRNCVCENSADFI